MLEIPTKSETLRQVPLSTVAVSYVSGGTPSTADETFWHGEVPWTTSAPISDDDVLLARAERFISRSGLEQSASNVVPAGNLVVGTRVGVGKAVMNCLPLAISQDLTGVVLDSARADAHFLAYQFKTDRVQDYFQARSRGTTIKGVSRFDLERLPVWLPSIPEQRAIALALDAVKKSKETRQRELALELERKAALMKYLFTHGTRGEPTKQTEAGEIPESWQVLHLEDVATIERGKFAHRPRNAPEFYGGSIPFIQTGDVANSHGHIRTFSQTLNERGLSISRIFPKGTIVITIAANIGFTAILDFDSAFPDSLIGITPREGIVPEFLSRYLATQQPEMDRKAPRGTQKNINIEFLKPWPVIVPPSEEQAAIATVLHASDDKIEGLQHENSLLDELFRAMLEELMTGRLSGIPVTEEHQPQ